MILYANFRSCPGIGIRCTATFRPLWATSWPFFLTRECPLSQLLTDEVALKYEVWKMGFRLLQFSIGPYHRLRLLIMICCLGFWVKIRGGFSTSFTSTCNASLYCWELSFPIILAQFTAAAARFLLAPSYMMQCHRRYTQDHV